MTWKNIPKTTWEAKREGEREYFYTKTGLMNVKLRYKGLKKGGGSPKISVFKVIFPSSIFFVKLVLF